MKICSVIILTRTRARKLATKTACKYVDADDKNFDAH